MAIGLGIDPPWVEDLLGVWAADDLRAATRRLGFASVSPMFARGVSEAEDEDGSYSGAEVAALKAAVERLRREHEEEWRAVQRAFRPWTRHAIDGGDDLALVQRAATRLAAWVDEAVDG